MEILPCLVSTVLSLSNLSWSASARRPRGSQKPRGGWAPSSDSKDIFKAEDLATWETGAKAVAPTRKAMVMMVRNNFSLVDYWYLINE